MPCESCPTNNDTQYSLASPFTSFSTVCPFLWHHISAADFSTEYLPQNPSNVTFPSCSFIPPYDAGAVVHLFYLPRSEPYDPYLPRNGSSSSPAGGSSQNPKTAAIQQQIDDTVGIMRENITKVAERGERLDSLQDKTGALFCPLPYWSII